MLIPPDKKSEAESQTSLPVSRPSDNLQLPFQQYDTIPSSSHSYTTANDDNEDSTTLLLPPPYAVGTNQRGGGSPPYGSQRGGGGKPKSRSFGRFIKAAGWAVLLLVVAAILGGLIGWLSGGTGGNGEIPGEGGGGGGGGGGSGGSKDSGGKYRKGPLDGKGSWNNDWSPITPILSNETSPRTCDTFSPPSLLPTGGTFSHLPYYHIITTHILPLSARHIYFHGRGTHLNGHVETSVGKLDRGDVKDGVVVRVEVVYARDRSLEGWHVCRAGDEQDAGVVLVMPRQSSEEWRYEDLSFYIHIDYPSTSHQTSIGELEISTSNMGVTFNGLQEAYHVSGLNVHTSNAMIAIDGLETEGLDLSTSNGKISAGIIRATGNPRMHTSNGMIECRDCCASKISDRVGRWDIVTSNGRVEGNFCAKEYISIKTSSGMIHGEFEAPKVGLKTSNGQIQGKISGIEEGGLDVTTSSGAIAVTVDFLEQGKRLVEIPMTVSTSNGLLDVDILNLPTNIVLDTRLRTSNARLIFKGHPHFQGDFSFATSSYESVTFDTLDSLPGEESRKVDIGWSKAPRSTVSGSVARQGVKKGDKTAAWGRIIGETSNGSLRARV